MSGGLITASVGGVESCSSGRGNIRSVSGRGLGVRSAPGFVGPGAAAEIQCSGKGRNWGVCSGELRFRPSGWCCSRLAGAGFVIDVVLGGTDLRWVSGCVTVRLVHYRVVYHGRLCRSS